MKLTEEQKESMSKSNLKLVWKVVSDHFGACDKDLIEELYEVGLMGLAKALNTYDADTGFAFTTYAYRCIKVEMMGLLHYMTGKKRSCYIQTISLDTPTGGDDEHEFSPLIESFEAEQEEEMCELYDAIITQLSFIGNPYEELKKIVRKNFIFELPRGKASKEKQKYLKALKIYFMEEKVSTAVREVGVSDEAIFRYALRKALNKTKNDLTNLATPHSKNTTVKK